MVDKSLILCSWCKTQTDATSMRSCIVSLYFVCVCLFVVAFSSAFVSVCVFVIRAIFQFNFRLFQPTHNKNFIHQTQWNWIAIQMNKIYKRIQTIYLTWLPTDRDNAELEMSKQQRKWTCRKRRPLKCKDELGACVRWPMLKLSLL